MASERARNNAESLWQVAMNASTFTTNGVARMSIEIIADALDRYAQEREAAARAEGFHAGAEAMRAAAVKCVEGHGGWGPGSGVSERPFDIAAAVAALPLPPP